MCADNRIRGLEQRAHAAGQAAPARWRRWRQDLIWLALVALWVVVGLALVYRSPQPLRLDIGAGEARTNLRGFNEPETGVGHAFTQEHAQILIRGAGAGFWRTTLRFKGARPAGVEPARVNLGVRRANVTLAPQSTVRSYHLLIPSSMGDLDVAITANAFRAGADDARQLGIPVEWFTAQALQPGPPQRTTLIALALAAGIYVILRQITLPAGWSGLLTLALLSPGIYTLHDVQALFVAGAMRWPLMIGMGWVLGIVSLAKVGTAEHASVHRLLFLLLGASGGLLVWVLVTDGAKATGVHGGAPWVYVPVALASLALVVVHGSPRWRTIATSLIVLVALVFAGDRYAGVWDQSQATDFTALYGGPYAFWHGNGLYQLDAIRAAPFGPVFKYPPFFAIIMRPFTLLPIDSALRLWKAVQVALILLSGYLLWAAETKAWRRWSTLWLLLLIALFQPLANTIEYGQVDILLLALLAAGFWALRRKHWTLLGVLLAPAALIKLYPVYLLLLPLVRKQWRSLWGFSAGIVGLGLASVVLLGAGVHVTFLRDVLPISGQGTGWHENQTFNGVLNRLLDLQSIRLAPTGGPLVQSATYLAAIMVTLLVAWRSRSLPDGVAYGMLITAMLLVVPVAWIHYETLLIIPLYALFVHAERIGGLPWRHAVLLAAAWGLLCFGNENTFFYSTSYGPFWAWMLSYKFYGLVLLLLVGLASRSAQPSSLHLRARQSTESPQANAPPLRSQSASQ